MIGCNYLEPADSEMSRFIQVIKQFAAPRFGLASGRYGKNRVSPYPIYL